MRCLFCLLALAGLLTAAPKRLELGFPGLAERVQIVFPENYDPGRKWPAVFYYHGTNGKPTTDLIRAHTGDQDFFVVGMTYLQKGKFTFTKETLEAEWRILHSTRNHLATKWESRSGPRLCRRFQQRRMDEWLSSTAGSHPGRWRDPWSRPRAQRQQEPAQISNTQTPLRGRGPPRWKTIPSDCGPLCSTGR